MQKKTLSAAGMDRKPGNELMNLNWRLLCSQPVHSTRTRFTRVVFARVFIASSLFSSLFPEEPSPYEYFTASKWTLSTGALCTVGCLLKRPDTACNAAPRFVSVFAVLQLFTGSGIICLGWNKKKKRWCLTQPSLCAAFVSLFYLFIFVSNG